MPETKGEIARVAYESLAMSYRSIFQTLEEIQGQQLGMLRIVGGGCQNRVLNQFTADALNRPVITGPIEAIAIGNILMQMFAMGDIASLADGREIIRNSFAHESKTYLPQNVDDWQAALVQWRTTCRRDSALR